jgi:hypothetical protein
VLPGTEKAEFLAQLSHHQTRDALLTPLLQEEIYYSIIDVDAGLFLEVRRIRCSFPSCHISKATIRRSGCSSLSPPASVNKLLEFSMFVAPEFSARGLDLHDRTFPLRDRFPQGCPDGPPTSKLRIIDSLDKTQSIRSGVGMEQARRCLSAPKKRMTEPASSKT